ncbi:MULTISPECIES: MarR family winged helix-turn-helix transcriptional regulator [Comamonas]|jgi:MarR family transcriptional regulator for hemolysin|uniref:Winged helix DNA-binding protein n=1 Tax=Comamonas avium TaxID=2762231 RepID=A0ABR8SD98_9BURK|nr:MULTISPECIES: winged helix DNA-binding protein [Comamonas]MBD7961427.1 winged helix DNA-binding protein [Comamonas avium]MBD9402008.1 winged helix DNA-binding protein [Comamonas sp. CMM02]
MQTNCAVSADEASERVSARSRFGLLIGSVYRQWRRQVDLSFKDLGLSDATRMPLLVLHAGGVPMRQKDLAEALYLDTSSLVRVLSQLRAEALVDWSCDPTDRRTKYIELTQQGQRVASLILQKSLQIEQTILAGLTPEELQITRASLLKISQRFDHITSQPCGAEPGDMSPSQNKN